MRGAEPQKQCNEHNSQHPANQQESARNNLFQSFQNILIHRLIGRYGNVSCLAQLVYLCVRFAVAVKEQARLGIRFGKILVLHEGSQNIRRNDQRHLVICLPEKHRRLLAHRGDKPITGEVHINVAPLPIPRTTEVIRIPCTVPVLILPVADKCARQGHVCTDIRGIVDGIAIHQ